MATVDNDIIKITLSNTASGNTITVSPGVSALSSVSLSLNDLSDIDTTGISNGQTIVYQDGSFVAGDAGAVKTVNSENPDVNGNVDISLGDVSQVSITSPSDNQFLKYSGGQWVNDQIEISYVNGLQAALDDKADGDSVPQNLNDLGDVTIVGTPTGNQALIYDAATSSFKALASYTNRFEDDVELAKNAIDTASSVFIERSYSVKSDGDGIFIDPNPDTPTSGNVIVRKIYHKSGFITSSDVIGDYTLIHTFADDTAYTSTVSTFESFRDGNTYGTTPFTLIQVWEEQAAAPAFTGLLNESYGSGAAAAYSVRRLNGNYTGSAVQLERTSDNSFQDIGFDVNGDLDESAITTFCTGTTCKVRTWYDQSGNANNAVQTTHANQPTIYTGGAIVKNNGRPSFQFVAGDFISDTNWNGSSTSYIFNVLQSNGVEASPRIGVEVGSFVEYYGLGINGNTGASSAGIGSVSHYSNGAAIGTTRDNMWDAMQWQNVLTVSGDFSSWTGGFGLSRSGANMYSYGQEFILYNSDKSTDRTDIEENIGDYFTQNTPLLDTYTGAAAAYSLRKLRTAYTGSAIRVRRASDNTEQDIGFNVFGELDTVSLASFCSGTNGFVKTWYDQSGNSNDATQTSAANQPKIYDSLTGVVLNSDSKPACDFNVSSASLGVSNTFFINQDVIDMFVVVETNDTSGVMFGCAGTEYIGYLGTSTNRPDSEFGTPTYYVDGVDNGITTRTEFTTYVKTGVPVLLSIQDGDTQLWGDFQSTLAIGSYALNNNLSINGKYNEIVIYASDQSSNRTNIEDNINTFYSIY